MIIRNYILKLILILLPLLGFSQKDYYWVGGNGVWEDPNHWATTSGGNVFQAVPPTILDNVYFDDKSFKNATDIVTVGGASIDMHDMIWKNVLNGVTFNCGANISISGSMLLVTNMSYKNNSGVTSFVSNSSETVSTGGITAATVQILKNVTFNGNGTWSLLSYLNVDNDITLDKGTFISNGNGIMCSKFISTPAVLTNKRVLDIRNSTFKIKSSDNGPYLSWNVVNFGNSIKNIPDGSIIEFRGSTGLSTMLCGHNLNYNDVIFMFEDGIMKVSSDTIHDSWFNYNGEIIGDTTNFHNVTISINGLINGRKNNFNDITISKVGNIGNYSLAPTKRNVDENHFNTVKIGKTGRIYGDKNVFINIYFSYDGTTCFDFPGCSYCGKIDDGELHGDNDSIKNELSFKREGKIYANNDVINTVFFWCDGWIYSGSNKFDIINFYRHFQECKKESPSLKPLSVHSNSLYFQSNKTQTITNSFNLLGDILCGNTSISSTNANIQATIYSYPVLSMLYVKLMDINGTNIPNKPDTAKISSDMGGNKNWNFADSYADIVITGDNATDVSPCFNSTNGTVTFDAIGGIGKLTYAKWIIPDDPWIKPYWQYQNSNIFTDQIKGTFKYMIEDALGCSVEDVVIVGGPTAVVFDSIAKVDLNCFQANNGEIHLKASGGKGSITYSIDNINYFSSGDFTGIAAGDYTITAVDPLGCSATDNRKLEQPTLLELYSNVLLDTIKCRGFKQGKVKLRAIGGVPPYSYKVVDPDNKYFKDTIKTSNDTLLLFGGKSYYAIVTDSNKCTAQCNFDITEPDSLMSNFTIQNISCTGKKNGKVKVNPIGGTPPYTYSWSNGIKADSITNLMPGKYWLKITDKYGCPTNDTVQIKDPLPITISFSVDSVNCKGGNDGTATVIVKGGTPGYAYNWDNGSMLNTITQLTTGNHFVTVTDLNGCIGKATVVIPEKNGLSFSYTVKGVSCNGKSDGSALLTVKGGTLPYTYKWFFDSTITGAAINNVKGGKYAVQITDMKGCLVSNNVTIPEPNPLQNVFLNDNKNCLATGGSSVKAKVSGGTSPYTYKWKNGEIKDSLSGIPNGIYYVTITDKNGCQVNDSVEVSPLKGKIDINSGCTGMNNATATAVPIGGTSPFTYKWAGGQTTATISGLTQGSTYFVTITDKLGCIFNTNFTINKPSPIKATTVKSKYSGYNVSCFDKNDGWIDVKPLPTGGVGPYKYKWSNDSTDSKIFNLKQGIYSVTITDNNDCPLVIKDTIKQPNDIQLVIKVVNLDCKLGTNTGSATAIVTGGVSPYTYLWSNGGVTNKVVNLPLGNFTITVTDKNLCPEIKTITIGKPAINIDTVIDAKCSSTKDGSILISVIGGTPPFQYKWSNGSTTQNLLNVTPGYYSVTATDSLGCVAIKGRTIGQPFPFVYDIIIDSIKCKGDITGGALVNVTGGQPFLNPPYYKYLWSTGDLGDTLNSISGKTGGIYTIKVTDSKGCWEDTKINIYEPKALTIKIDSSNIRCFGNNDAWIKPIVSGGSLPYSYTWYYNGNLLSSMADIIGLSAGQYDLTVTDKNQCPMPTRTVNLVDNSPLRLTFNSGNVTCKGKKNGWIKAIVTGGSKPYTFAWNNGIKITKDSVFNLSEGYYKVSVTDMYGCYQDSSIAITEPDTITLQFNTLAVKCYGDPTGSAKVIATGGTSPYNYLWSTKATDSIINNVTSGQFKVSVTDKNGCRDTGTVIINQNSKLIPIPSPNLALCKGDTAYLYVKIKGGIPDYTYKWDNSAYLSDTTIFNPVAYPKTTTTFKVTITDYTNCSVVASTTVNINPPMTVKMGNDTSICLNTSVKLNPIVSGGSIPYAYQWTPTDSISDALIISPVVNPIKTTVYKLQVKDKFDCSTFGMIKITVNSLPKPDFLYKDVCFGQTMNFTDNSKSVVGIKSRKWDFGDLTSDIININPSHNYLKLGSFNVLYSLTDNNNCIDTIIKTVKVNPLPKAKFVFNTACLGQNTYFFDSSKTAGGISKWLWKFEIGDTSNIPNPNHYFLKSGNYPVSLKIDNIYNCSDTYSTNVYVDSIPNVKFSYTTACLGDSTYFKNKTSIKSISIKSFRWLFGDGTIDTIHLNPSHKYQNPGVYNAMLIIVNTNDCSNFLTQKVNVNPAPYSDFVCPHVCYKNFSVFEDKSFSSLSVINKWEWNFGDGTFDFVNQNPKHLYNAPGIYKVKLTVYDLSLCQDTAVKFISVDSLPSANFISDTVCFGSLTNFTDLSKSHGSLNYLWCWDFKDGTKAYYQNPSHFFPNAGTYNNIMLVVTNQNGCNDTVYKSVKLANRINVSFTYKGSCLNDTTYFTNTTKLPNNSNPIFLWDFGDGNSSSLENPKHKFKAEGNYNIKLLINDQNSCLTDTVIQITLNPLPIPDFSFKDVCFGQITNFIDNSLSIASITSRLWNFGDNTTDNVTINPSHNYSKDASFAVSLSLTDINNCSSIKTKTVNVYSLPQAKFVFNTACLGQSTYFFDSSKTVGGISKWLWDFGDGGSSNLPNPNHYYLNTGKYKVSLTIDNIYNCTDTFIDTVYVDSIPNVKFTNTTSCIGDSTYFNNISKIKLSSIKSFKWSFGDGSIDVAHLNTSHKFFNSGVYSGSLLIINTNGCSGSFTKDIEVKPTPYADFVCPHVCFKSYSVFEDKSYCTSSALKKWKWEFDDGTIDSINQNPKHLYKSPRDYNVQLTIYDTNLCKGVITKTIAVDSLPIANFVADTVCPGNLTHFTDMSKAYGSFNSLWAWDFRDGTKAYYQDPSHFFPQSGSYDSIMLVVTNQSGCKDTVYKTVKVGASFNVSFTYNIACLNDTTYFENTTKFPNNAVPRFNWDFGDGKTSKLENPKHRYKAEGTYNVKLIVSNKNSCLKDTVIKVKVVSLPIAKFFTISGKNTFPVLFTDKSVSTDGLINKWDWTFGDGESSTIHNPTKTFKSPGYYDVTLVVTDSYGCKDTARQKIFISTIGIVAAFNADTVCFGSNTTFKDKSTIDFGVITDWKWEFGDTSVSIAQNPVHRFKYPGTYFVSLIILGNNSSDTLVKKVIVNPKPIINFTNDNNCEKRNINFNNLSYIKSGNILSYKWSFGNRDSSFAYNPATTYDSISTYKVKLIATSDLGCKDSLVKYLTINSLPILKIVPDINQGCQPLEILLTDSSKVAGGFVEGWYWNFGDNFSATFGPQVKHTYLNNGYYDVSLRITTNNGCTDSLTLKDLINVHINPVAGFEPSPRNSNILKPTILFDDKSTGAYIYKWNFGDSSISTEQSPKHTYNTDGSFLVMQYVENEFSCKDSISEIVNIEEVSTNYIPSAFTPNHDGNNDVFIPQGIYNKDNFIEMTIFNRWGQLVYKTEEFDKGWNGRLYNTDKVCPVGIYVWGIKTRDINGFYHKQFGNISLIR